MWFGRRRRRTFVISSIVTMRTIAVGFLLRCHHPDGIKFGRRITDVLAKIQWWTQHQVCFVIIAIKLVITNPVVQIHLSAMVVSKLVI